MEEKQYQNWQCDTDADQILWVCFDKAESSANSLDKASLDELEQIVEAIMTNEHYRGVIFTSAKKGFIAGADIHSFLTLKKAEDAYDYMRHVQNLYRKIENLPIPTVAMIDGHCLGGGFELALACRYRVACESDSKDIGFPEVFLGIFPAWGGSVRATRLVGLMKSLPLILQGNTLRAKQMQKIGLIDVVQPRRHLRTAAKQCILHPKKREPQVYLSNMPLVRKLIARRAKSVLAKKHIVQSQYPAPFAAIDFLQNTSVNSAQAFDAEARAASHLVESPTTANLVRLFFLRDRLKKFAKNSQRDFQHVHVIGAGTMGADIAAWCASKGMVVTLQDMQPELLAKALKRMFKGLQKAFKNPVRLREVMDRVIPDVEGNGVAKADVIIEAIVEDVTIKQQVFKQVESKAKADTILATNTSSIPLQDIAAGLKNSERLLGLHFFNPVAKMQLVEVIRHQSNDDAIVNDALRFVGKLGKLPVPMHSGPGFVVNRILMPYLMQAFRLYEEGVAPTTIDKLAIDFGMPMGPVTLADMVGLDVCLHIVEMVGDQLHLTAPAQLKKMVSENKLGVKSGRGFYYYRKGEVKRPHFPVTIKDQAILTDRLILPMLNEAVNCLHDGVIEDADLLDAAMVFGTGFAPFRGGPIQYAKTRGVNDILIALKRFNAEFADDIHISEGWSSL